MIHLHGKLEKISEVSKRLGPAIVTDNANLPEALAANKILLSDNPLEGDGYLAVLRKNKFFANADLPAQFKLPESLWHLSDGDIVVIDEAGVHLRVLFRKNSPHNSILLTERCNHYCLMCSQPPKNVNDSWLLEETKQLIKIIPSDTPELGFTGGEPTTYGSGFIELMWIIKSYLPQTAIHILSNGRSFSDWGFAKNYSEVGHQDMMLGIPLYSDDPVTHNYVVQSNGAFDETIRGIINLKALGAKVEVRFVIHRLTVDRLVSFANFMARNLLFVDHVALMGLEITGFTRANLDLLWIDPFEYRDQLSEAVGLLRSYGMNVSVYNHQRCLVNEDILPAYRKSISDWKNEYVSECSGCSKQSECGGFFSSQKEYKYSQHIRPFPEK